MFCPNCSSTSFDFDVDLVTEYHDANCNIKGNIINNYIQNNIKSTYTGSYYIDNLEIRCQKCNTKYIPINDDPEFTKFISQIEELC